MEVLLLEIFELDAVRCQLRLCVLQFLIHLLELFLLLFVKLLDELVLLAVVRQDDNVGHNFGAQLGKLVVSFLDLLIEGLIFDFQLFKIDEMEPISKLLLLAQDLLLVLQPVAQCNVLQAVLVHLLVLGVFGFLPFLDCYGRQLLAVAAVDRILRH